MKIKELQEHMAKKGIDFCLFYNLGNDNEDANMFYFTGYNGNGALVIGRKKKYLVAPRMERERAGKQNIKVYKWEKERLFDRILMINKGIGIKNKVIGIDKEMFTLKMHSHFKKYFKKCRTPDISGVCSKLRETKTKKEIIAIKKACAITDSIIKNCFERFGEFKTEADVAYFLESETKKRLCELAFKPIVASGADSSMPHSEPQNSKLKNGFCVIDFGVRYRGYCSDVSRTVYIGKPKKYEVEIYNLLLRAQYAVINSIKEGIRCSQLVETARKGLGMYEKNFIHGLGHGIGIKVHELPSLRKESKDLLKRGMIFSVEPGIYFKKRFGIRIEDDVLIKKDNKEVLTKTTKKLLVFKKRE